MSLYVEEICKHARIVSRPEYYSGRGATTSDLTDEILERAFEIIDQRLGKDASAAYVQMVKSLPIASATGYLRGLYELSGSGWTWPDDKKGHNDIYAADEASGFATIFSVLSRRQDDSGRQDYFTRLIRDGFLKRHGALTEERNLYDMPRV